MMRRLKNMVLALLRRPAPHGMTNLLLRLVTGADIAWGARIYYPFNVRIGRGCRIGLAKLAGHPWRGLFAPTLIVGAGALVTGDIPAYHVAVGVRPQEIFGEEMVNEAVAAGPTSVYLSSSKALTHYDLNHNVKEGIWQAQHL